MSNSDIEQAGTVKGHIPNGASLSGRISNVVSLSGHISIGSVAGDFIIKMTVELEGSELIVTSCDTTVEQIDEAVAAEKRVVLVASVDGTILELPMVQGDKGYSYNFCAILSESVFLSSVYKIENKSDWSFGMIHILDITAEDVSYHDSFELGFENVGQTLDALVTGVNETRKDVLRLNKSEHTHSNKSVLDKFTESDGKPTYNGEALGSDFIIKMNVTSDDNGNYTVTSCDTTVEQIDSAVAAEKRVVLIATDTDNNLSWDIPIVQGFNGSNYYFATFLLGQAILSFVEKVGENKARWQFMVGQIGADFIGYSNAALPNISTVGDALNELVPKSHTHSNKTVLDKFAESDGKPTYNGEALGGGTSDFIINMTVEAEGNNYIVTSCDKTMEQIDAAVASGQNIKAIAFDKFIMPMTQIMEYGVSYTFGAFLGSFLVIANVDKNPESGTDEWQFYLFTITADIVEYSNDAMPNISTVGDALNELVPKSHTHSNKLVLDKFSETDGKPTYGGEALGSGAGDFIIKMTVEGHDEGYYTVTSCDATIEQIDAAVSAEKRVVLITTNTTNGVFWELPIVEAYQGQTYIFIVYTYGRRMMATLYKSGENEIWEFTEGGISAESIDYYNSTQPDVESVYAALNKLFTNSHTHSNKDTLDKLSDSNGKLQYNGSDVGLKPVKGTDYWTESDKQEIVNDTLAALPTWIGGGY